MGDEMKLDEWADSRWRPREATGGKSAIGVGGDDYSNWRRGFGSGCSVQDLDYVEYRFERGEPVVVAVIEVTFYDDVPAMRHLLPKYRECALARFSSDSQRKIVEHSARLLRAPAYFAVIRKDLEWFMVNRLDRNEWREFDRGQYRDWIMGLRPPAPEAL